jgi:hypothetical protein
VCDKLTSVESLTFSRHCLLCCWCGIIGNGCWGEGDLKVSKTCLDGWERRRGEEGDCSREQIREFEENSKSLRISKTQSQPLSL